MEIGVSNEIQRTVLDSLVPYTYVGPRYAVLRVILLVVDGIKGSTSYTAPWERKYSIAVLRTTAGDPSSAVHDARVTILLPFVTDTVTAEPHVLDPLVFMGFLLQMFEFFLLKQFLTRFGRHARVSNAGLKSLQYSVR